MGYTSGVNHIISSLILQDQFNQMIELNESIYYFSE